MKADTRDPTDAMDVYVLADQSTVTANDPIVEAPASDELASTNEATATYCPNESPAQPNDAELSTAMDASASTTMTEPNDHTGATDLAGKATVSQGATDVFDGADSKDGQRQWMQGDQVMKP